MVSRKWLAALALLTMLDGHGLLAQSAAPAQPGPGWREAPDLGRMFTPRHVPEGSYRAYVSPLPLEAAVKKIKDDPAMSAWPDGWQIESLSPNQAFGQAADYDIWGVARLYGGTAARVARAPRMESGQPVEVWTAISPYPDVSLTHLEPGTLLIVLKLR